MSMLQICASPGCGTRTLGEFCIAHEDVPSHKRTKPLKANGHAAFRSVTIESSSLSLTATAQLDRPAAATPAAV
jgi:hypothetical protein